MSILPSSNAFFRTGDAFHPPLLSRKMPPMSDTPTPPRKPFNPMNSATMRAAQAKKTSPQSLLNPDALGGAPLAPQEERALIEAAASAHLPDEQETAAPTA